MSAIRNRRYCHFEIHNHLSTQAPNKDFPMYVQPHKRKVTFVYGATSKDRIGFIKDRVKSDGRTKVHWTDDMDAPYNADVIVFTEKMFDSISGPDLLNLVLLTGDVPLLTMERLESGLPNVWSRGPFGVDQIFIMSEFPLGMNDSCRYTNPICQLLMRNVDEVVDLQGVMNEMKKQKAELAAAKAQLLEANAETERLKAKLEQLKAESLEWRENAHKQLEEVETWRAKCKQLEEAGTTPADSDCVDSLSQVMVKRDPAGPLAALATMERPAQHQLIKLSIAQIMKELRELEEKYEKSAQSEIRILSFPKEDLAADEPVMINYESDS